MVLIIYFAASSVFSQSTEVFAPFVSKIKVAVKEPSVKITWRDAEDIEGSYLVYRHNKEITDNTFPHAQKIAEIDAGKEHYIDQVEQEGTYYYAILAKDKEGNVYELFIPYRNKTIEGVIINQVLTEEDLAVEITQLETHVQDSTIVITFKSKQPEKRKLLLFRSTNPIMSFEDLEEATMLREINTEKNQYKDTPVAGTPYYYAIVDARLYELGKATVGPGENASEEFTMVPIEKKETTDVVLQLPDETETNLRPTPLPYFLLSTQMATGQNFLTDKKYGIPQKQEVTPDTAQAIDNFMKKIPDYTIHSLDPDPNILNNEHVPVENGEESELQTILNEYFLQNKWVPTEEKLTAFLNKHLSHEVSLRSYYYRGQARYFLGNYRYAFLDFVLAREMFFKQTEPWIDAILVKLYL